MSTFYTLADLQDCLSVVWVLSWYEFQWRKGNNKGESWKAVSLTCFSISLLETYYIPSSSDLILPLEKSYDFKSIFLGWPSIYYVSREHALCSIWCFWYLRSAATEGQPFSLERNHKKRESPIKASFGLRTTVRWINWNGSHRLFERKEGLTPFWDSVVFPSPPPLFFSLSFLQSLGTFLWIDLYHARSQSESFCSRSWTMLLQNFNSMILQNFHCLCIGEHTCM